MQSVETPLLGDHHAGKNTTGSDVIPDNRLHLLDNQTLTKTVTSPMTNTTSSIPMTTEEEDEYHTDGDPLLICVETGISQRQAATPLSPMSESCDSSVLGEHESATESALATPMEVSREFPGGIERSCTESDEVLISSYNIENYDSLQREPNQLSKSCNPSPNITHHTNLNEQAGNHKSSQHDNSTRNCNAHDRLEITNSLTHISKSSEAKNTNLSIKELDTKVTSHPKSSSIMFTSPPTSQSESRVHKHVFARSPFSQRTESDHVNSDSTMKQSHSQLDWKLMEQQLKKAAMEEEEQRRSKGRRNDREEIRRKLAMEDHEADDFYGGVFRMGVPISGMRRSSSTSAAGNMSLQICFMNDPVLLSDDEDLSEGDHNPSGFVPGARGTSGETSSLLNGTNLNKTRKQVERTAAAQRFMDVCQIRSDDKDETEEETNLLGSEKRDAEGGVEDFFTTQTRLQAEAKMALAQTQPMAEMQMELEKMNRKKSPIAGIVGLQGGFVDDTNKLTLRALSNLNLAQLQVILNDLHTQIENYNDLLLKYLEERDDLHMEQDAKLVDIEDLTRRFKELAEMAPRDLNQSKAAHSSKSKSRIF